MKLSLKPDHLRRYKNVVQLIIKYGGNNLVSTANLDEARLEEEMEEAQDQGEAEQLARDLEDMGPTFIKLGQLLSTRPDLLPPTYLKALSRLQDRVEPFSFEEVQSIVAQELGVRLSKAFSAFDERPIAAASLAQVHRARLREGEKVVVKVQRPGIRRRILTDLETLDELTGFIDEHTEIGKRYAFRDMLDEFRRSLLRELDYRQEAQNLVTLGDNLQGYDEIVLPRPIHDYTTSRVLTMTHISGSKITRLNPVVQTEIDGEALADALCRAYLDQVLVDGLYHADPHPGNVFLTDDHRLALLDLGMVARIDPEVQEDLLRLLLAISTGHGHETAEISLKMGTMLDHFDDDRFTREVADLVGRFQNAAVEDIHVGRIVMEVARISGKNGVRPAPELTMLGKTLFNLDEIGRTLSPSFNPNAVVRRHAESIMQQRTFKSLSPSNVLSSVLEMNELVQKLPSRLNTFFEALSTGKVGVRIHMADELHFLSHLHRMTNRISLSLVLSALIIGAAMLMRVETTFTILGYPGIAMIFFLIAVACGFALVVDIIVHEKERKEPPY